MIRWDALVGAVVSLVVLLAPLSPRPALSAGEPVADVARWIPLPASSAESPRFGHTAVWTGTEMIVWGGTPDGIIGLSDGANYLPGAGK